MQREIITTQKAPTAIGPYSQAIKVGEMIYTSGQIPICPETGKIISTDFKEQVVQVLNNLSAVLESAGSSLKQVVKLTVFIIDLSNFALLNEVFKEYFPENPGARSAVQVTRLPLDVQVEIEAVAVVDKE